MEQTQAAAMGYDMCKKQGGKCTTDEKGQQVCTMNGKTYTKPAKAQAAIAFTKFEIETDGTATGTKILLNGKPIENLGYASLSFFNDGLPNPLSLSFTTKDKEPKPGSLIQTSYYSLIPPKEGADASKAQAAFEQQPAVPAEALPRDQRQNIYRNL